MIEVPIVLLRFVMTFVLSFLFGLERQRSHKPVGFGTFIFVSLGACALSVTAKNLSPDNPLPLLGAIVSGIGFLGAGALIRSNEKIFGFTTAASIWLFAVVGLVIGVGEYLLGLLIYLGVWVIVVFDKYFEDHGIGHYQRKVTIVANKIISEKELRNHFLIFTKKYKLIGTEIDKKANKQSMTYLVEGTKDALNNLAQRLYEKDWFDSIKTE